MGELMRDPDLDRLVQEMNEMGQAEKAASPQQRADSALPSLDSVHLQDVHHDEPLQALLLQMVDKNASDLILVPGAPPVLRIAGTLRVTASEPLWGPDIEELFTPHLGARSRQLLRTAGSADFSLRLTSETLDSGWRLRVNVHRQQGALAAAVRALPRRVPTLTELNLPEQLSELTAASHGLVLLCGPTGAGKSTTLAALVGQINREQCRHVITIEDPIEYEHRHGSSIIEQVQVGSDAVSFASALRAALRRDPDVILVGEMRDLETIAIALTAAETGHLIFSTLHTHDVAQAVHRIVDVFPSDQQSQIRQQLALSLSAVVCQQLVPRLDGRGRLPALEVLHATYAIRNHIRKGNMHQLYNEIQVGRERGMVSLEESLAQLVHSGLIAPEEARARAGRPDELERML
jgi:twitching motility protein PilT